MTGSSFIYLNMYEQKIPNITLDISLDVNTKEREREGGRESETEMEMCCGDI